MNVHKLYDLRIFPHSLEILRDNFKFGETSLVEYVTPQALSFGKPNDLGTQKARWWQVMHEASNNLPIGRFRDVWARFTCLTADDLSVAMIYYVEDDETFIPYARIINSRVP